MSNFALTKASAAALGLLCRTAGTDQLLLIQPARELRAEITVEPIGTADQRGQIEAVLHLREQRHSITLQRDDGANAQHLAEWVEAAANGTLDTALAIPQRAAPAPLLPCRDCGSEAIGYDYASQGSTFRHGVKCRHRDCQSVEGAETATEAHTAWNEIQAEPVDEPDSAQDEQQPVLMVRTKGSPMWEQIGAESFEFCQQDSDYECREFYAAPIAQPAPQPEQSELVEALQRALGTVEIPAELSPSKAEYFKAGARAAAGALSAALSAQATRPAA